jgi:hypothetical protein
MGKYNGFVRQPKLAIALAAALIAAGCMREARTERPPAPPRSAAMRPAPPATSFEQMPLAAEMAPEGVALNETAPMRYVVKRGDTLWDISKLYLRDPWQWPELWYANPQVKNPHLIYPGDELSLIWVDGRPKLVVSGTDVKLSPQIREIPLEQAIPTIPIEVIRAFLRGPRLVTRQELERAPYVLEFADEHIMGGAPDRIFVKDLESPDYAHAVVRMGEAYRDPDDGSILGYEAIPIAEAEMRDRTSPAVMQLVRSYRETQIGDRLLPIDADAFQSHFYPHAPVHPVNGQIISVFDGVFFVTQFQIVALNRGSEHGLEPGHVLSIYQNRAKVDDPYGVGRVALPQLLAGTVMVFKTTPRLSFALVMSAQRQVRVLDVVDRPRSAS